GAPAGRRRAPNRRVRKYWFIDKARRLTTNSELRHRGVAALAADPSEIEDGLRDRRAGDLNALQVARTKSHVFRQFQSAVATFKRGRAAVRHGVETHHGDRKSTRLNSSH